MIMNDRGRIIIGLIVFIVLMTFPVWYNLINGVQAMEDPVIMTEHVWGKQECVMPADYMKTYHMDLLNAWRDEAVRENHRVFTAEDGRVFNKSLTGTCMDCHENKEQFCDRCHNYMAVTPYCWDCHLEPKEYK